MSVHDCHSFNRPYPGEVLIGIKETAHDPFDAGIKLLTHGRGSHAFFIRGNGNIIENFYPRVHERGWNFGERRQCDEFRIAGTVPADWSALEKWFDGQLQAPPPYSIADLFRYAVNLPPRPGASCFCSMWVLRGCRLNLAPCKQPLTRLEYPDYADPHELRISPLLIRRLKP